MTPVSRSLDRSLALGIAWTGGVKWVTQFISWGVTLVVARLLAPADYGLFGMAMVYLGIALLMAEAGLLPVVIQPKELTEDLAARLGGLGLIAGLAVCFVSMLVATPVAWFFHEDRVRPVIMALSLTFILRGLQLLPRGLLIRELDFRRVAWLDAIESLGAATATVTMAVMGLGYWALVGGALAALIGSTIIAWIWRPHRITLRVDSRTLREPLRLGWQVLASQFAWYAYSNADFAIVGRLLGRAALGAYSLAWTIANVPVDRVTSLVGRVAAPVFSAVQQDKASMRRYLYALTEGLALITLPACAGLAMIADVLVDAVLVPSWREAVTPLRILALYAAFRCVTSILSQVLIFTGNARRNMQINIAALVSLTLGFLVGSNWGTTGVAMVWLTVYPTVIGGAYIHYALRIAEMPLRSYLAALAPAAGGTAAMAAALAILRLGLPNSLGAVMQLAILVLGGTAVYTVVVIARHGPRLRVAFALLTGRQERVSGPTHVVSDVRAPSPGARLLLISWHFPPDAAVGALRWQKLVKLAAERGWGVDVVMRDTAGLAGRDDSRLADLPPSTRLFHVPLAPSALERITNAVSRFMRARAGSAPILRAGLSPRANSVAAGEVGRPRTLRDLVRAWHAWEEHQRGRRWTRDAARAARRAFEPGIHRAIVSCGPPHWAHVAALRVSRETRTPLIADFRDPWSLLQRLPEHIASPLTLTLAARDEARVMRHASVIVANTPRAGDALRTRYPAVAERIIDVPNGFDEDPLPAASRRRRFVVAYAGTIYLDRDPRPLCRAVARVLVETRATPEEFGLEFMGDVAEFNGARLEDIAREEGVAEFVSLRPPATRARALEFLADASMLVVLPQDSDMAIPAKLFEYMRFPAWVLVCGPKSGAARAMVEPYGADGAGAGDVETIAGIIQRRFGEHRRGVRAEPLARHVELSRRFRASKLFDAIEAITGKPAREVPPKGPAAPSGLGEADRFAIPTRRTTAPLSAKLRAATRDAS